MSVQDCAEYFRNRPAYQRMLEQMRRKYQGLGRLGGQVCLNDATAAECEAARAVFGRFFAPPVRFTLLEFETALQTTTFRGVSLLQLLEAYFGVSIQTHREEREQKAQALTDTLERVEKSVDHEVCRQWLHSLLESKAGGYALVRASLDSGDAETALTHACKALAWLESHPEQSVRLAVLSANTTSDPHALDIETLAGKLLLHLLAFQEGAPFPSKAEQRDSLYYQAGILCDSISSSVTQIGLILCNGSEEHPAFGAFRQLREICTLTLTNLSGLTSASSPSGKAYLVENQMVFSQLCDHAQAFHSPLICTSGQLQLAALRLLDMLTTSDTKLFYSGDFDGGGLSIAEMLIKRYPNSMNLWHMGSDDYAIARSEKKLEESRLQSGSYFSNATLASTAKEITKFKSAGYQELLLPHLLKDLTVTL